MIDLNRASESINGLIVDGVVLPDSIFERQRSSKVTYSNDLISTVEYFNSLTQITANRIAKIDLTYSDDFITSQTVTYYGPDGTTPFDTETHSFVYSGDDLLRVEVS